MSKTRIGFALTGSFCTFEKAFAALRALVAAGYDVLPVLSYAAAREDTRELEGFYDRVRQGESAMLFASSFEQELGDELGVPVLRIDYPVFDRVVLSDRPYVGVKGTLCLVEDILNEIFHGRTLKGGLYQ